MLDYLNGQLSVAIIRIPLLKEYQTDLEPLDFIDFQMILGCEQAKRALEIAAAGGYHFFSKWSSRLWEKYAGRRNIPYDFLGYKQR